MSVLLLRVRCEAAAPLVVNGGAFVGCQKEIDHEGQHEVVVYWGQKASNYKQEETK